jgi:hypothetical protein
MADQDGAITIYVSPKISPEDLERLRQQLMGVFNAPIDFQYQTSGTAAPSSPSDDSRKAKDDSKSIREALREYLSKDENKRKLITSSIKSTEVAVSASLKKGFGIVEEIYAKMKQNSPLLQAIESIFQLAMMLFFMPIGNKLGEVLIPATLELLDNVIKMWDAFEGQTLGQMFATAISQGVKLFGEYFNNIGDILIEQGGMVGNIGTLLKTLGSFIEGPGVDVLNGILSVVTFVLGNFKHFVSLWVAMKTAEITMNSLGFLGDMGANVGVGAAALITLTAAGSAFATSEGLMAGLGREKGDYVPATPGGRLRVLGEGGRGEYVIPEDKMDSFGGGSVVNNFYGYNEDQLIQKINDIISQQISQSRLRSGF